MEKRNVSLAMIEKAEVSRCSLVVCRSESNAKRVTDNRRATKTETGDRRHPKKSSRPRKLPMMPIRDVVIFPYMMTPFVVGRESSVRALEEALAADKKIFLATQHDAGVDEPKPTEIYQVGTVVNIVQSLKLPDGNIKVLVEGIERGKVLPSHRDRRFHASVGAGGAVYRRDQSANRSRHAAGHGAV